MATNLAPGPKPEIKIDWNSLINEGQYKENQPFLLRLDNAEKLYFQSVPHDITHETTDGWQTIQSPGRNNPLYQYTGSEDTLTLEISWYSNQENRQDVLKKMKWLQALRKANGYLKPPPIVALCFGDLFKDARWIVSGADPKYSGFSRQYKMMPLVATTTLVLKRVSEENTTWQEILKITT